MSSVRRSTPLLLCCLLVMLGLPAGADPDQETARQRRETIRARFVEDQEPVQNLAAMATTPCVNGFAGSYPCSEIDLLAFMPLSSIGGGSGNDIWGWTDPLTGNEYAIMGRSSGTSFVDITDPANPVYLGNLPPHGANSSWRDIKVYADHAYIVSEAGGHGMQVFDLTQLRSVAAPPVTFGETAHYGNFGSCHNVAINEDTGFAYAIGTTSCAGGPHFVDLADPVNPVFAGCHPETLYTHDTQCVVYNGPDADYSGREICFNSNETRVNVIDVTDHSASFLISSTVYAGTGYVHQGWLTEDQRYYMQGDELDEQNFGHNTRTRILDMTDLDQPVLIANFDHQTAAIDHNLYTLNGHVYMANYRAGLRIMDLDAIASGVLTEVGYFDIYPSSDSPSFNGAWSVYPYFDSGVVVVSGIEQGLFILQPRFQPDFVLAATPATVAVCEPGLDTVDVQLTDDNAYAGNVSLSATGLPAGAIETFSINPVAVPGNSTLTIDVSGATPGNYTLTVSATDGTLTHDADVQLLVTDTTPGTSAAVSPAHGAIDVPRVPLLEWTAASQAANYTVEISTDPGFGSLAYSTDTTATTHIVSLTLDTTTTYFWRIRATNACGTGAYSATSAFTTLDVPDLLVVDDDDNGPDVRVEYGSALTALGRDFNVWDTNGTDDEPSAAALAPYNAVIWFTGDAFGGSSGPGAGAEQALASWLDTGGCLLISSQDYFYDRGLTGFMSSHLGVSTATSDITSTTADGRGSVFGGIGPYNLSLPYPNHSDGIFPDASAERAFQGDLGSIAINKDGNDYRTAYLGFGVEGLPTASAVESTLSAFLNWCDALLAQDDDADGTPNGDDCAPQDGSVWSSPSAVYGLTISEAPADNVNWSPPAVTGASSLTYDTLRSGASGDFLSASCMETNGTDTVTSDAATPAAGQVFYYLIRVENTCGSNLGNGGARSARNCP